MSKKQDTLTALSILLVGTIVLGALFVPRGDSRAEDWALTSFTVTANHLSSCAAQDEIHSSVTWTQPDTPWETKIEIIYNGEVIRKKQAEYNAGQHTVTWDNDDTPDPEIRAGEYQDIDHDYGGYELTARLSYVDTNSTVFIDEETKSTPIHIEEFEIWYSDIYDMGGTHSPATGYDVEHDKIYATTVFIKESDWAKYVVEVEGIEVDKAIWGGNGCQKEYHFNAWAGSNQNFYNPDNLPHSADGSYMIETNLYQVDNAEGDNPQLKKTYLDFINVPHTSPTPSHTPYPSP